MGNAMSGETDTLQDEAGQAALKRDFLVWQCAIRKNAVRYANGKPQDGMRPFVRHHRADEARARITTVVVPKEPQASTMEFRHIMRRSEDPVHRTDSALNKLGGTFYEDPAAFSDKLTALFGPGVPLADEMKAAGTVVLDFEQGGQQYTIPCRVTELDGDDPAYQATYWHNQLFNAEMPPGVRILRFDPDWERAGADPIHA